MAAPAHPVSAPGPAVRAPARGARLVALALITLYQGLRGSKPSPCRYFPTCSAYASEAIERHGVWVGSRLTARRLARCRPHGPHGVDQVPLERPRWVRRPATPHVHPAPAPEEARP
jgi:putative membrane protein insertion efficiency factor